MKAYLEKIGKYEWMDDFVYISRQPLVDFGYEISAFDGSDMSQFNKIDFKQNDIVIGSVEATVAFFKKMNVPTPKYIGYPESIQKFLGRKIRKSCLGEIKTLPEKFPFPFFVKPAEDVKKFTGSIIEKQSELDFLQKFENVRDLEWLYVSDSIDIVSEYRCFVHRGTLKGIHWYRGDFTMFPDVAIVKNIIKDYVDANVAYTLDIGILADGSNVLVEVNDFWAIGSYGLSGQIYARMAADRFRQIMGAQLL